MPERHKSFLHEGSHAVGPSPCQFLGVDLRLAPGVLVPRGETELLGHTAIAILEAMAGTPVVIDMCCGSGNLAIAIAHHCRRAAVWAADQTDETVRLARNNAARLGLSDRITVRQGDLFEALASDRLSGGVDMVVCNPPYISSARLDGKSSYLLAHEPRQAFDGGPYGISILQRLIRDAVGFLKPDGWLLCEFGEGQERQIAALVARAKAYGAPAWAEIDGRPRVLIARRRAGEPACGDVCA